MVGSHIRVCAVLAVLLWLPATLLAQQSVNGVALHVSVAEGTVWIQRTGQIAAAEAGHILEAGDRLRTEAGRAVLLFSDGTALHLDAYSSMEVLDDLKVKLLAGQAFLYVELGERALDFTEYRIETPGAFARVSGGGVIHVSVVSNPDTLTELVVMRGRAWLGTDRGQLVMQGGEHARARAGQGPGVAEAYDPTDGSEFDEWSAAQRSDLGIDVALDLSYPVFREDGRVAEPSVQSSGIEDARSEASTVQPQVAPRGAHSHFEAGAHAVVVLRGGGIRPIVDVVPKEPDEPRGGSISSTIESTAPSTRLRLRGSDTPRADTSSGDGAQRFRFSAGSSATADPQ